MKFSVVPVVVVGGSIVFVAVSFSLFIFKVVGSRVVSFIEFGF